MSMPAHPPKGVLGAYARSVLDVLVPHFPDLANPATAEAIGDAIQQHHTNPGVAFGVPLDADGDWRLRPRRDLPGHVWCACWKPLERITARDCDLVQAISVQLDALPGRPR